MTEGAVSQWITRGKSQGAEALRHRSSPGAPPKVRPEQQAQLPSLLARGAEAFGFRGAIWTAARVAVVIKREYGVNSHPTHCSRLLCKLRYSQQKPVERASQREEAAIKQWREQRSVERAKKATEEKRTIVCGDQSAFYLLPLAVRTSAPVGQTPVLKVELTRDHFSVMGALTLDARLIMRVQDTSYKGPDVVRFLQLLLRKVPGKLLVLWDRAPIHRCQAVKEFLSHGGAKCIHLERLPGYAPELNPQEGVWNLLKRCELKNLCAADFGQLAPELVRAKQRLRHRKTVLRQCIAHAGFPL